MFCLGICSSKESKEPESKKTKMEQLLNQNKKEVGDVSSKVTEPSYEEQKEESKPAEVEEKEPPTEPIDDLVQ